MSDDMYRSVRSTIIENVLATGALLLLLLPALLLPLLLLLSLTIAPSQT